MGYPPGGSTGEEESKSTTKVSPRVARLYQCGCMSCGDEWASYTIPKYCGVCRGRAYYY